MTKFAVLFTCFNRKKKTISALKSLYTACENFDDDWSMTVYLTDDNSSDGTSEAVEREFPNTIILKGNGSLYWAGGMRHSWSTALKNDYDAYLLLNDDTNVYKEVLEIIKQTDLFAIDSFGEKGIYVGATMDKMSNAISYGGHIFKNRFMATMKMVPLHNKIPQECELGNANIMWVPKEVVNQIGILSEGYLHGMADYDYTLKARKKNIPVLIMPGILGDCVNDHSDPYLKFMNLSFKERIKMLYNPVGLDFSSQIHHMKKHFPLRFPLFYMMGWFKVFFPKLYYKTLYKNRIS